MRVLLLTRYSRAAASSRLRALQYLPWLETAGVEVVSLPLLGDGYVQKLYREGSGWSASVLSAYWQRFQALLSARQFDLLWIEKELFPWFPALAETLLGACRIPYVVDYDDALFHRYDLHPNFWVRTLLAGKIDRVMRHAALVVAGNEYIAARARQAGARRVEILPTSVDLTRYALDSSPGEGPFTIGWIGTPVTAKYLCLVEALLAGLSRESGVRLVIVGSGEAALAGVAAERRAWREESEAADIRQFDVGIMPLPDEPWERGKCGYKLIQYMACGKPVVASPVGVNRDIVVPGENGFLATSPGEWLAALRQLRADPQLRQRMGLAGRAEVERSYSLQVNAPKLLHWLREVGER